MSQSCCEPTCCGGRNPELTREPEVRDPEATREIVRRRYGAIAREASSDSGARPAEAACSCVAESYEGLEGHAPEADLNLGCGLPTAFASLKAGETVVDLGSGAGNDAFIAGRAVGESGRVVGIDMTPEMVEKAEGNREKLGAGNVEFRLGEIEALPLEDAFADVVISNCVLNLVPDKRKAFAEIHRILKPGGRFSVSDIVTEGPLPEAVRESAPLWAGCVAGALEKERYLEIARESGFAVSVEKERPIDLPREFSWAGPARILSVTLAGKKAGQTGD